MSIIHDIAVVVQWLLCIIGAGVVFLVFLSWVIAMTEGPYGGPFEDESQPSPKPESVPETPPYKSLYV